MTLTSNDVNVTIAVDEFRERPRPEIRRAPYPNPLTETRALLLDEVRRIDALSILQPNCEHVDNKRSL